MKKLQHGKSATRNEYNTKKVQHEVTREKVQREKSETHKKVQYEQGTTRQKCNLKRVPYKKVQHG